MRLRDPVFICFIKSAKHLPQLTDMGSKLPDAFFSLPEHPEELASASTHSTTTIVVHDVKTPRRHRVVKESTSFGDFQTHVSHATGAFQYDEGGRASPFRCKPKSLTKLGCQSFILNQPQPQPSTTSPRHLASD